MSRSQAKTQLDIRTTAEITQQRHKEERKSRYFFIRRVPIRRIERDWKRPPDADYQRELLEQGFVTQDLLKGPISAELEADLRELEQHLLQHFWRVNQHAKYFQNRYYQYQWLFILSAFLTTALAAVNVLIYAQGWQQGVDTGTFLGTIKWQELLGFLTAVVSGIAATVSFLDANQTPQSRWFKARAQAESLRSLYFLFLARQNPFNLLDPRDRLQELRRRVLEVLTDKPSADPSARVTPAGSPRPSTQPSAPSSPAAPPSSQDTPQS